MTKYLSRDHQSCQMKSTFFCVLEPLHEFLHLVEKDTLAFGGVCFFIPLQDRFFAQNVGCSWKARLPSYNRNAVLKTTRCGGSSGEVARELGAFSGQSGGQEFIYPHGSVSRICLQRWLQGCVCVCTGGLLPSSKGLCVCGEQCYSANEKT